MTDDADQPSGYLAAEAKARVEIDRQLAAAGWVVQNRKDLNLHAGRGVAVREFTMEAGHGRADYLLFVDRKAVGTIEAKPEGTTLTEVELQSADYVTGVPAQVPTAFTRLPFAYESTGSETRFTNGLDPYPRSRRVFTFFRPETLADWVAEHARDPNHATLRARLGAIPVLKVDGLWPSQFDAITNLERSFADARPRALIQMATGSGKTFTAANVAYRLAKYAGAKRILFLVDRGNLGRQALNEFQQFSTPDDGRKFTSLYNVQHATTNRLDPVAKVTICTVQRLYSILRGEELDPDEDERSGFDVEPARAVEVDYNPAIPPEFFDFVVVDECHRSIYGVWRQVLEYFDAFLIGLTATPLRQTLGFFNQNLVVEYDHVAAVADGVNVDFDVYRIKTRITEHGSEVEAGAWVGYRDRATRRERWEALDEPLAYDPAQLDRNVLARDQIRTIVRTFKEKLFSEIFPGRTEVPKTLIFAKTDAHADDVVQVVREEFGRGNEFAKKITYRTTEGKPEDFLASFRNSFNPRIVVTVDMIATGTDIKPLECILFMRATKSRSFFEQMKGRGVRIINDADFQAVTPDARAKTHFVIVDAVGVTETELNDSYPLERKPTVGLNRLFESIALGQVDADIASSVAARLLRLDRQITRDDRASLDALTDRSLRSLAEGLLEAADPDRHVEAAQAATGKEEPTDEEIAEAARSLLDAAAAPLAANPALRQRILDIRKSYEQVIDEVSVDEVIEAGISRTAADRAAALVGSFREYLEQHRDEITALQFFYNIPFRERPTLAQLREFAGALGRPPLRWTPEALWAAYEQLDRSRVRGAGGTMLTDLVSIIRYALDLSPELVPYRDQVQQRFEGWLAQQHQAGTEFTPEQQRWLEMIRDHVASSLAMTIEDFDLAPFTQHGGIGKAVQLFGRDVDRLLADLSEELVA